LAEHSIEAPSGIIDEPVPLVGPDSYVELSTLADPIAAKVDMKHSPKSKGLPSDAPQPSETTHESDSGSAAWSSRGYTPGSSDTERNPGYHTQRPILHDPRIGIDFVLAYVFRSGLILMSTHSHYDQSRAAMFSPLTREPSGLLR
jgi:hypothetical protein